MNMPLPDPGPDEGALQTRLGQRLAHGVDAAGRVVRHPLFWLGAREIAGVSIGMAAWAFVTGVAMVKSGLGVGQASLMTLTVYSGSMQLAVLPLIAVGASVWVIWLAAFCVGLRFVVFSLHLRDYLMFLPRGRRLVLVYLLGDVSYVLYTRRYAHGPHTPRQRRAHVAYLWGCNACLWVTWQLLCFAGIFLGAALPAGWGLEFSGTLALLALTCSLITTRLRALAAVAAGAVAVVTHGLPWRMNVILAIMVAMAICLFLEKRAGHE